MRGRPLTSYDVGEDGLHPLEEVQPPDEDAGGYGGRNQECGRLGGGLSEHCPPKPLDDADHRIESVKPSPFFRDEARRIGHGRSVHPELDDEGDYELDVAVFYVQRGKPEAELKAVTIAIAMKSGRSAKPAVGAIPYHTIIPTRMTNAMAKSARPAKTLLSGRMSLGK